MKKKGSHLSCPALMSLSVLSIQWKNLRWSRQTLFFLSLLLIIRLTRWHAMYQMMVLLCLLLKHCLRHLNLLGDGFHLLRNTILSHGHQSGILVRRWTIWKIKFIQHLSGKGEQWRYQPFLLRNLIVVLKDASLWLC